MALKTLVKVGEVNNLSDGRYCAGMGVDLIGFNLDKQSEGYIGDETFHGITGWLEGIKTVGEFDVSPSFEIEERFEELQFDMIQVNDALALKDLESLECEKILQIICPESLESIIPILQKSKAYANLFLLERPDQNELSDQEKINLKAICTDFPVVLGFGFTTESLSDFLEEINPVGIALKGGEEIRPGYRDFDEMADILEELEVED
jgi:phosphoribosylanthranilate isomerase